MAIGTVGNLPVLGLELHEPRQGVWLARVELDGDALPEQPTLTVTGVSWSGTAWTSGLYGGQLRAVLVGGAGGLSTALPAKSYRGAAYGAILADILSGAGETAAANSTDLSSSIATAWTRSAGRADQALDQLAASLGLTWRVLRDGTVWIGTDDWADVGSDYVLASRDAAQQVDVIQPFTPIAQPGKTLDGHEIDQVVTEIAAGGLVQEVWWQQTGGESDTIAAVLGRWADRTIGRRLDYLALYPASVVTQAADGTLELLPDDARIKGYGLLPIRIRTGIPGCAVKVEDGARVLIGFEAGDPARPYASLWDGAYLDEITITAATKVTVDAPAIDLADASGTVLRSGDLLTIAGVQAGGGVSNVAVTASGTVSKVKA